MKFIQRSLVSTSLFLLSAAVFAAEKDQATEPKSGKTDDIRVMLAKKLPGAKPEDVRPTPINGIYEITLGSSTGYITADGKYLISGDLYEIASKTNLSEARRSEGRVQSLAVGSSRVDLQACKLEYSIVSPK